MKTLIIHPTDHTTEMLNDIYRDLTDTEIINEIPDRATLLQKVSAAERVFCLGHGLPQGLLDTKGMRICVDAGFAEVFRRQPNNIYVWCNADVFMEDHGLSGFATGMFISEVREANIFNVPATQADIDESNNRFTDGLRHAIRSGMTNEQTAQHVLSRYRNNGYVNHTIAYNRPRIYAFNNGEVTMSADSEDHFYIGQMELERIMEKRSAV